MKQNQIPANEVSQLPENVITKFKTFKDWHINFKRSLNSLSIEKGTEIEALEKIFPNTRDYYFNEIETFGELCKDFNLKQKKEFFKMAMDSGLLNELKGAPYYFHSIFKPRGYAGDAEMMSIVYRNAYEGESLFLKLMHKIGADCAACVAIRNRKELILAILENMEPGKVLSLAAGSAQEIYDYKRKGKDNHNFLALDHDIETLKSANKRNEELQYGLINAFHLISGLKTYIVPKKENIETCNPIEDMKGGVSKLLFSLKYDTYNLGEQKFDFIYSAGLFDYIKTYDDLSKGTIALTKILFDLLEPKGRLLIGNVSPEMPIGVIWYMECICDWYLIYRTEEEVLKFAESIPKNEIESIEVIVEETGVNWFLEIRKK
ncbi:MAG: hypothetical protein GY705_00705 [Bacteroidetes bacterium]|nr:hypothetical protein [Bacteroidota bacterium]